MQNGTPFQVAAFRGILTAILVGTAAALATWSETESAKLIIIAGATPAIGILLARFGIEGSIDNAATK